MKKIDRFDWALWSRMGLLLAFSCLISLGAQAQAALTWAGVERYTNTGSGDEVAAAPDGSLYVSGTFWGTLTLGTVTLTAASGSSMFLAKYSAAGTVLWAQQQYGSFVQKLAVDAGGNAYLAGGFGTSLTLGNTVLSAANGHSYLVKYDGQGAVQVLQQGGGATLTIIDMAIGASGNIGLLGLSTAASTFGGINVPGPGICYYKLSPTGTMLLGRQVSTNRYNRDAENTCLTLDSADNVYLAGPYGISATFGTFTLSHPAPGPYMYLCKLDATGTPAWLVEGYGERAADITVDAAGNPIVAHKFGNQYSQYAEVARYDTQGSRLWQWGITGVTGLYSGVGISGVAYDGSGGYYVTGYSSTRLAAVSPAPSTGFQLFVVHLNSQGAIIESAQVVGTGVVVVGTYGIYPNTYSNSIAVDASGTVYVVGTAGTGTLTFGPTAPVVSVNAILLLKFRASGALATTPAAGPTGALRAYPNPAREQVVLDLPAGGGQRLAILDVLGRTVRQQALPTVAGPCPVPLAGLAPGLYQLRATLANGQTAHSRLQVE